MSTPKTTTNNKTKLGESDNFKTKANLSSVELANNSEEKK